MGIGSGSLDGNGNDVGKTWELNGQWECGYGNVGNGNLEPIPAHLYCRMPLASKMPPPKNSIPP